jgi:hypothetical protein
MSNADIIATGALLAAAAAAVAAFLQLRSGARVTKGQFLLDMDQAFEADREIRNKLASPDQLSFTPADWHHIKAYMSRFERVNVFISERLLDAEVIYRLYGSRLSSILRQTEIRQRLLENPERALNWSDFNELWSRINKEALKATGAPLCSVDPPPIRRRAARTDDQGNEPPGTPATVGPLAE